MKQKAVITISQPKGIDVSAWNGDIDWKKVKASGIEFAILRVASSTFLDKRFLQNINGALAAQIPCGVYLYSYAQTKAQAVAEAEFALKTLKPYALSYPVFYDIEDKAQHDLTTAQRTGLIEAFCQTILAGGRQAGVYASLSWFLTMFDLTRMEAYPKWIAQWGEKCTFSGSYFMWQNSNVGKVDGITGDVDLNIAYPEDKTPDKVPSVPPITVPDKTPAPSIKPPDKTPVTPIKVSYPAGTKLNLRKTPLYSSATAPSYSALISGSYLVYDGLIGNGRMRITNSSIRVGKAPVAQNVTGYITVDDVRNSRVL